MAINKSSKNQKYETVLSVNKERKKNIMKKKRTKKRV